LQQAIKGRCNLFVLHSFFNGTSCTCWEALQVIPAENLVAAFQSSAGQLLGVAASAADARVMLEALEVGTAGVLLRTEDPLEV
jgi:3-dehydroquinate synthase class II